MAKLAVVRKTEPYAPDGFVCLERPSEHVRRLAVQAVVDFLLTMEYPAEPIVRASSAAIPELLEAGADVHQIAVACRINRLDVVTALTQLATAPRSPNAA